MEDRNRENSSPRSPRRRFLAKAAAVVGALTIFLGGAFLTMAGPAEARRWMQRHEPCSHEHGRAADHARWITDRALDRIDATEEQRERIVAIVDATVAGVERAHEAHEDLRDALVEQLTADSVDRSALEKLRTEKLAGLDGTSERVVVALADIADLLTPEQRMKLAKTVSHWHR